MPRDTIFNGCGDESLDSFCTHCTEDCSLRGDDGVSCTDTISSQADLVLN